MKWNISTKANSTYIRITQQLPSSVKELYYFTCLRLKADCL